jgi:predicted permease
VVLQVALSFVLLVASGLMVRSFGRLVSQELGFSSDNLLTADLQISPAAYAGADRTRFFREIQDEIEALPGVRTASFVNMLPVRHRRMNWGVWVPGRPARNEAEGVSAWSRTVISGYFDALGIPMIHGRDFRRGEDDGNQGSVVINQSLAEALFPGEDAVGREVACGSDSDPWILEVVGVVDDVRINGVAEEAGNQMYFHHALLPYVTMEMVVRARSNPAALAEPIRGLLRRKDPDVPLAAVATMGEIVSESLVLNRVVATMSSLFAAVALFLTLTGLYGVLAFYVQERTHELGVRMALGAGSGAILGLVVRRGLLLVGAGLALGLAGALGSTRLLGAFLYQVEPTDPGTFGAVTVAFLVVGSLACLMPGWRATRLDPVRATQGD